MISICSKENAYTEIDTVLFDKDGTLIDSHLYWGRIIERRVSHILEFYGIDKSHYSDLCLALGYCLTKKRLTKAGPIALFARDEVIECLLKTLKKLDILAKKHDIEHIFDEEHSLFREEMFDYIQILDGAQELLKCLKDRKVKLAVVTSDSKLNTEKILEYLGIDCYFDLITGKDCCCEAKKTGKPAEYAMQILKSLPEKTVCVGDSKMDSDMAKNAHLNGSILVATGQTPLNELHDYSDFVVESLMELKVI